MSYNSTDEIISEAMAQHIGFVIADDKLQLRVPKNTKVTPLLLQKISEHKDAIKSWVLENGSALKHSNEARTISRADRNATDCLPLSFFQDRLWLADQLQGGVQHHIHWTFRLEGTVNVRQLEAVFRTILERHEALRTVIRESKGMRCQEILPSANWRLLLLDGSLAAPLETYINRPFNLAADYMLRVVLVKHAAGHSQLLVVLHHIAFDGRSIGILIHELQTFYGAAINSAPATLPPLPLQYADYALWQRNYLAATQDRSLDYWKEKLKGVEGVSIPADRLGSRSGGKHGAKKSILLDKATEQQLLRICRQEDSTLFMLFLTVYKALLYRYVGAEDICVGTSIDGRRGRETEQMIGFFVNMLSLRSTVRGDMPFEVLLREVRAMLLDAYDHQEVPFERVVESIDIERKAGQTPVFQVIFVLHNLEDEVEIELGGGVRLIREHQEEMTVEYDLGLHILHTSNGIGIQVVYNSDLYTEAMMTRLLGHYRMLLRSALHDPGTTIANLQLLTPEEEHQQRRFFNMEPCSLPASASITALFSAQAAATPDAIALAASSRELSYATLDERTSQLAAHLAAQGTKPGDLVAICIERSAELIIGILAILKTGAGYVPVDPSYPQERIAYILEDSGVQLILVARPLALPGNLRQVDVSGEDVHAPSVRIERQSDSLSNLMYTSGSTGTPKGVRVKDANVISLVKNIAYVQLGNDDVLLSTGSPSFDATTFEYWGMLLNGGKLVMCPEERLLDPVLLKEEIIRHKVTCMWFTAGWLNQLVEADISLFAPLKTVLAGGDRLSPVHLKKLRDAYPHLELINGYGPTENTTFSLSYCIGTVEEGVEIPIGRPLDNRLAFILDTDGNLCPVGIEGELHVGGAGLSGGYHNQPGLTAARFVHLRSLGLLYRTGDRAKWMEDGNVAFLGRKDDQVKLRGYRIEPGEIVQALEKAPGVQQAEVVLQTNAQGDKYLAAYITIDGTPDREEIDAHLAAWLPDYMIPASLTILDQMPLTANGKVDRKALPVPDAIEPAVDAYTPPRNEAEQKMADIWADVLEVERVGIHDNFFDLGGHSLLAIRLITSIRDELELQLSIRQLFNTPTIAGLELFRVAPEDEDPVLRQERPAHIPLSYPQEMLWFIDRFQGSVHYHMPWRFRIVGPLNIDALENAFKKIIERHEVLRTAIRENEGAPYQHIDDAANWRIRRVEAGQLSRLVTEPYNLAEDTMLRVAIATVRENEHELLIMLHHIAFDAWSIGIMLNELISLYNNGQPPAALPVQYADYAIWQRNRLSGARLEEHLAYWTQTLAGWQPLEMITDKPRPAEPSTRGASVERRLDEALTEKLKALCQQEGVTFFMTVLALYNVLLYRYSGQNDFCVGTPVAGRDRSETGGLIGFFVNTLVLRNKVEGAQSFRSFLQQLKQQSLSAFEHQETPFGAIVEALGVKRSANRNPLFQVMFALQNVPVPPLQKLGDAELLFREEPQATALVDLDMDVLELDKGLLLHIRYSTDIFTEKTIAGMLHHYEMLLRAVLADADTRIDDLGMLSVEEERSLLDALDRRESAPAEHRSVVTLFDEQAKATPEARAILFENQTWSYRKLKEKSEGLSALLTMKGAARGDRIGICVSRGPQMIVSLIAVLRAGAAYVPIDPELPPARIASMLEDAGCTMLVTDQAAIPAGERIIIHPSKTTRPVSTSVYPSLSDLAYVIYTSGSTGTPKGVMISHASLLNYCLVFKNYFGLGPDDCTLQQSSVSFDTMVEEIYPALLSGAAIRIIPEGGRDVETISRYITNGEATIASTTPLVLEWLNKLLTETGNLRYIITGGDKLQPSYIGNLAGRTKIVNSYGPSETTVCVTYHEVTDIAESGLIGKTLPGSSIYLMDRAGNLLPAGRAGEICVGGRQVGLGYTGNAALSAERFVPDPFASDGALMYRTGDLGRLLPGNRIEFLGRRDEQVKIRGYRIELHEIEYALQALPGIAAAVVVTRPGPLEQQQLVAFVVPGKSFDLQKTFRLLRERLPEYMIPAVIKELDALPLNVNGKVDRKALPDTGNTITVKEDAEPRTPVEIRLGEIWSELLKRPSVGIHDNFFELGGHSLLAVRMIAAINKSFNHLLRIKDLFLQPTIAALATLLDSGEMPGQLPELRPSVEGGKIPLSFAQERLWFIDRLRSGWEYNMPWLVELEGDLDMDLLERAFREVVRRHEVLRTVMLEEDGMPYQHLLPAESWKLDCNPAGTDAYLEALVHQSYRLDTDLQLRVSLIKKDERRYTMLVMVHHIAFDGWSLNILINEVCSLYNGFHAGTATELPQLDVQYSDYAQWQRTYFSDDRMKEQLDYWRNQLDGLQPLELPADHPYPAAPVSDGASVTGEVNGSVRARLLALSHEEGATLFTTLLAAFQVLLHRYSGQEDVCVGIPVSGRQQPATQPLIGFFVNTLPIRSQVSGDASFRDILQQVKRTTLESYQHQEVPFEKIVDATGAGRDHQRNPLFNITFTLDQEATEKPVMQGVQLNEISAGIRTALFEVSMEVTDTQDGLSLRLIFRTDLYEPATMERMKDHYITLLHSIVEAPATAAGRLKMVKDSELQTLHSFNYDAATFPRETNIVQLFLQQVAQRPDKTAISCEGEDLSYAELDRQSERLAHYLQTQGVQPESLVTLCLPRSLDMIVALLAVLKTGAAYLPIDPAYPAERIGYVMNDSRATLLLTVRALEASLPVEMRVQIIYLDELEIKDEARSAPVEIQASSAAYVIYTSGSTGNPKGVVVEHRNVVQLFLQRPAVYHFTGDDVWALFHSYSFDFSVWEIFGALLFGGRLVIVPAPVARDVAAFTDLLVREKVTVLNHTPGAFYVLQDHILGMNSLALSLRYVIFGGEMLHPARLCEWQRRYPHCQLVNMYGITETTVHVTFKALLENDTSVSTSNIGKALPAARCYVLDRYGALQPIGIPGELHVGGAGVARGYLHRAELSAERFIKDPFSTDPGARLYKSGDLVRWLPQGELEYLGRIDMQVKIRGYRIELGEVEHAIIAIADIIGCVVVSDTDGEGNNRLVAYISSTEPFDKSAMTGALRSSLPEYMVPAIMIPLNEIPLTANGKVDRRRLPSPVSLQAPAEVCVPPQTPVQQDLAAIWSTLLKLDAGKISIHDNFFELGGHSLLVTRMIARLKSSLSLEIPVHIVFMCPTIYELSRYIELEQPPLAEENNAAFEVFEI